MATTKTPISSPQYRVLAFDLIGTLLNYEPVLHPFLLPLTTTLPAGHPFRTPFPTTPTPSARLAPKHPLIDALSAHEDKLQADHPTMLFEDVLRAAYRGVATDLGVSALDTDADAVVTSMASWPVFPDTIAAMIRLHDAGYKLVGVTNNSRAGAESLLCASLAGVPFDAVYTAEEIGAYKPARRNFEFLLGKAEEVWGVGREGVLWIAHGVGSDQVPAEEMGIRHVWVERGVENWGGLRREGMVGLDVVRDMEECADKILGGE